MPITQELLQSRLSRLRDTFPIRTKTGVKYYATDALTLENLDHDFDFKLASMRHVSFLEEHIGACTIGIRQSYWPAAFDTLEDVDGVLSEDYCRVWMKETCAHMDLDPMQYDYLAPARAIKAGFAPEIFSVAYKSARKDVDGAASAVNGATKNMRMFERTADCLLGDLLNNYPRAAAVVCMKQQPRYEGSGFQKKMKGVMDEYARSIKGPVGDCIRKHHDELLYSETYAEANSCRRIRKSVLSGIAKAVKTRWS
jgi:hypothetical protein